MTKRPLMRFLGSLAAAMLTAAGIGLAVGDAVAKAQAPAVREFDIPPQPLESALRQVAKENGLQLLYDPKDIRGLNTPGVRGLISVRQAVEKLLEGTGVAVSFGESGTVVLKPNEKGGQAANPTLLAQAPSAERRGTSQERPVTSEQAVRGEAITVTAQKRTELLIDVPQSVMVLSGDDLAKRGATQLRDFADTVPGLSFQTEGTGTGQISLRGVSAGKDQSPTVGIYVDEVPYGASSSFARATQFTLDAALFDLDRIEVLRGPQGTLYGASTMGGLIKYVTKRPVSTRFVGYAQAGISSTAHGGIGYNVAGTINAPIITDRAALRASAFYTRDAGYVDNVELGHRDVNVYDTYGARADLLFTPTNALTLRLTAFFQDVTGDGYPHADFRLTGEPVDGLLQQRRLFAESFDGRFRLVSGTLSYHLGPASLISISSYQTIRSEIVRDQSTRFRSLCPLVSRTCSTVALDFGATTDKFTQEVRLASEGTQALEWLVGGFFTRETSEDTSFILGRDLAEQPLPNPLQTFVVPSRYQEYAAFGDLTWRLSEKFDVTGGVRYARSDTTFEQLSTAPVGPPSITPRTRSTDKVFTYLANARYHLSEQAMGYVRYATGYRPGGPNYVALDPSTGIPRTDVKPTFEADQLKSYEIGFKAETADRRLSLDVSGYYIDWDNIITIVTRGNTGVRVNAAGGATIRGGELTITARPTRPLTVTGAFAYQDATLAKSDADLRAAKGERLPGVPRFTAALNGDYELPMESLKATVGATLRYVDDRTADFDNNRARPLIRVPDYTMVDLRAGVRLGAVSAQLYVRNLFDERGQLLSRVAPTTVSPLPIAILQPRTIGVTVSTAF